MSSNGTVTYNHQGAGASGKRTLTLSDTVSEDRTAPAKPVIPTSLVDKAGTRTQITVETESGATVTLYDHNNQELGHGVADKSGRVTISPSKDIPNGNVTARATDEAGNVSQPSDPKPATVPAPNPIQIRDFSHGDTSVTLVPNGKTDIVYI